MFWRGSCLRFRSFLADVLCAARCRSSLLVPEHWWNRMVIGHLRWARCWSELSLALTESMPITESKIVGSLALVVTMTMPFEIETLPSTPGWPAR